MGTKQYSIEKTDTVPCLTSSRWGLAYIMFLGSVCGYLVRVSMSVAIVCMTYDNVTQSGNEANTTNPFEDCPNYSEVNEDSQSAEFDWSRQLRGYVQSSFYLGYTAMQLPGGFFISRYGAHKVLVAGFLTMNTATLLCPVAARTSVYLLMLMRLIVGTGQGVYYPGVTSLWSFWGPSEEKSKLYTLSVTGGSVGSILSFAVSGLLCTYGFDGGWPSIFYIYGTLSMLWLVVCGLLVHDSPAEHPRISLAEKEYIEESTKSLTDRNTANVIPWKVLFTSVPVWAAVVATFCHAWGFYTVLTSLTQYMKDILRFDIAQNGLYSSLPYVCELILAISSSWAVDAVRHRKLLTTTQARKTLVTIMYIIPSIFLVAAGFLDCFQPALAITFMCISTGVLGFGYAGVYVLPLDFAPRYAAVVKGIINTAANIPGIIAPSVNAALTPNGTQQEWRHVFYITSALFIVGCIFFLIFGDAEVQEWAKEIKIETDTELQDGKENPTFEMKEQIVTGDTYI